MRNLLLLFLVLLVPAAAFADPLPLTDDLTGTITVYYDEQDPSAGRYEYSYRFPRINPDDAAAYLVNNFYESEVRYVDVYDAPTMADYYADLGEDYTVRITYEITLNSDEYFSVRLTKVMEYEGETAVIWEGNTFSRESGMPGSVFSLPNLLGRLEAGETDDWLEDRQVQKVRSAVYRLVWDQISGRVEDLPFDPVLTRESLEQIFDPELDFWLDETGNPVFFIIPDQSEFPEAEFLTISLTLEEIDDEI